MCCLYDWLYTMGCCSKSFVGFLFCLKTKFVSWVGWREVSLLVCEYECVCVCVLGLAREDDSVREKQMQASFVPITGIQERNYFWFCFRFVQGHKHYHRNILPPRSVKRTFKEHKWRQSTSYLNRVEEVVLPLWTARVLFLEIFDLRGHICPSELSNEKHWHLSSV